ncbi:hypothetical protein Salpa_1621 [Sporomusa sp. KB1]|jgi:hypothetical protein|nr:hypothetical protein Salpa_1621 [Sporomusa sp. KB1]
MFAVYSFHAIILRLCLLPRAGSKGGQGDEGIALISRQFLSSPNSDK